MVKETFFVVSGIVGFNDKILILKKSLQDRNFPGKWGFCSGYVKEFEPAEDAILREIIEETGLNAQIIKNAKPIEVIYKDKRFIIVCFLCEVNSDKIVLDQENIDYKWIILDEISNFDFVPGANKDLEVLGMKPNNL